MGIGQSEHQPHCAPVFAHRPCHEGGGNQLGEYARRHHYGYEPVRLGMAHEDAYVDNHAYADKEVRDEQGIAYEFQARHQRAGLRNEPVDRQSGKESAEQAFQSHHLCHRRADEHKGQDEDELHHTVLIPAQEPATDKGEQEDDEADVEKAFQAEEEPGEPGRVGILTSYDQRQHQEGGKESEGCGYHTDDDHPVTIQAVAPHDRIGDQRMTGIETGQQQTGGQTVVEQPQTRPQAEQERDGKGQDTETEPSLPVMLHAAHLQLQTGKEHYIIYTHLTEQLEGTVVSQQIEAVGTDKDACQDKTDDRRNTKPPEQQRHHQDDAHYHGEYPCRVGYEG